VGTVAWFTDIELIARSAAAYPAIHFVLVGPVQSGVEIGPLQALTNVSLWGPVAHERVPSIVNRFDACLIPFREGPISDSLCPVKFFEYLCLGKPVVSTPMPELQEFEHLYYSGRDTFLTSIERAVTEKDDALVVERRRVGRAHSWDALFLQLLEAVPEDSAARR
jgi:glycosyltransferase involved in cell wall biosynthesis